jgi:hypothetical protein
MLDSDKAVSSNFTPVTLQCEGGERLQLGQYKIQRPIEKYAKGTGKLVVSTWEVALALGKHWVECAQWKPKSGLPKTKKISTHYHPTPPCSHNLVCA